MIFDFSFIEINGISWDALNATPVYVPWYVLSSPQAVKVSLFVTLIRVLCTGHLMATVSTLRPDSGTLRLLPALGGQPPV